MQKKIIVRLVSALILICTLVTFSVSCGMLGKGDEKDTEAGSVSDVEENDTETKKDDTEAETSEDSKSDTESEEVTEKVDQTEETEEETEEQKPESYEFPEGSDLGGRTFTILNCFKNQWEQQCAVTEHEIDGTPINKAIFDRTVWLQTSLNCKLEEKNIDMYEIKKELDLAIDSGDMHYGVAYMQVGDIASEMISNRLTQLDYVSSMNLDEYYWNRELMEATSINNRHYSAVSDAHLMHFDGTWAVFFNTETLDAYEGVMESPYELVRNNEWTLETMVEMSRQLANLNGDNTWDLNLEGNAQYGFTTYWVGVGTLLYSVEADFGKKDLYDMPYLTCGTPDFTTKAQEVADFCAELGTFYFATADNNLMDEKADALFIKKRAAFAGLQLCFMSKFTAAGVEFGLVPFPKYDADQEEFKVSSSVTAPFMTIPRGYEYTEEIGLIMDAMSFEADRTLEKVYYQDHLQLKANTGEALDNIEMLNLIRERRSCDVMVISGLDKYLHQKMCYAVKNGGETIASTYEAQSKHTGDQFNKLRKFFKIS